MLYASRIFLSFGIVAATFISGANWGIVRGQDAVSAESPTEKQLDPSVSEKPAVKEKGESPSNEAQTADSKTDDSKTAATSPKQQPQPKTAQTSGSTPTLDSKERFRNVGLIYIDGPIGPHTDRFFQHRLRQLKARECDLVVIVIESPGGTLEESIHIAHTLRDVTWAKTIAYIPKEALSGAAVIAMGCDEIYMSSLAKFGDVGVIFLDPNFQWRYAPEKIKSDLIRTLHDLAAVKGRPPELAEKLVDQNIAIYQKKLTTAANDDGDTPEKVAGGPTVNEATEQSESPRELRVRYYVPKEHGEIIEDEGDLEPRDDWIPDPNEWELIPESAPGRFLEVNGKRAVELGIASESVESLEFCLKNVGATSPKYEFRFTTTDTIILVLNHPFILFLLLAVGLVTAYIELSAPGISVPGFISVICFVVFFWSTALGGTADVLEILLFVLGLIFLLIEIFVIPGFGVPGILGILMMGGSLVMATQTFIIPHSTADWKESISSLSIVVGAVATMFVTALILGRYFKAIPVIGSLALEPPKPLPSDSATKGNVVVGIGGATELAVGTIGVAVSVLRPAGKVRFGNATVDVVSDGSYIESDRHVRVTEIAGNRVIVSLIEE